MLGKTWQVSYGGVSVPCKTENDAKLLARQLMKKGYRVRAETLEGQHPMRVLSPPDCCLAYGMMAGSRKMLRRRKVR
jgi:hypothetical protein